MPTDVDTERRKSRILSEDSGCVSCYQLNAVSRIQHFPYYTKTDTDTDGFNETTAFGPDPPDLCELESSAGAIEIRTA